MEKKWKFIIILVLLLIFLVGGYFLKESISKKSGGGNIKEFKETSNQKNITNESLEVGLGNLCSGDKACEVYCEKNHEKCQEYCEKHLENKLCKEHINKGNRDTREFEMAIPGLCSNPEECRDYCEAGEENFKKCESYCMNNTSNEFCNEFFFGGLGKIPVFEIKTNFVDLDKVEAISKYRSCLGHVVVSTNSKETKRTMKHYFKVKPEYLGTDNKVEIYAPFDAYIGELSYGERCREKEPGKKCSGSGEMWLYPLEAENKVPEEIMWGLDIIHIKYLPKFKVGDDVRQGELLGYGDFVGSEKYNTFDIAVGKKLRKTKVIDGWNCPYADLDSVFDFMSNSTFNEYKARGITKENIIFSKKYRDENLCSYQPGDEPYFEAEYQSDPNQWIVLS